MEKSLQTPFLVLGESLDSFSETSSREEGGLVVGALVEREELLRKISVLNLLQQIATAANEGESIGNLLQFSLDRICAVTGWELGHAYVWSEERNRIETSPIWFVSEKSPFKEIRMEWERDHVPEKWNLISRVFKERNTIWMENIRDPKDGSLSACIRSAYASPIWVREKLVGVMEFFSSSPYSDPSFIGALENIGSQIGRVFERNVSEENLRNSREELRSLSARLQKVREEERHLIAREVHDELGQLLTVLKIDLMLLRQSRKGQTPEDAKFLEELTSMSQIADTAIESVQRIATELRPLLLDDLGLLEAIEWHSREFQKRTGIHCDIFTNADFPSPDRELAIALFRIIQETLTNVARHSKARSVSIRLRKGKSFLFLRIRDDGIGILREKMSDSKSLGLIGIRERAFAFGGEVKIHGIPGEGTCVSVRVPFTEEERI